MLYIVILPIIALLTLTALAVHSVIEKPYEIFKRSSSASTGSFTMPEGTTYIIREGVTSIGQYAFYGCSSLTSITIPEGVTSIGRGAFYYCSSLTSIAIPEGVTSIGRGTFCGCSSLTSITIPEGVTSIGEAAFRECSSLTSITIPEGVTSIGYRAFMGCSSLTSITIPASVTSIGDYAFGSCSNLTSITILEGVTSIGDNAFRNCSSLTSIAIPEGITSIGDWAFYGCSSLTSIAIPEGVTSIGYIAFSGCSSLTSITIPLSVTSIGIRVFEGCSSLSSITIPASVTSIDIRAFMGCSSLTSITIPASVTSIGGHPFYGCSSLAFIIIPEHFANKDDNFWRDKGINRANTKLITQAELDTFKKENKLEGSYGFEELAKLYSITEDNNYQPTWRALSNRSPLGNILVHDVLMATPASKTSCLPDIISQHSRIPLGRDNISILLGTLGKWAVEVSNPLTAFLTVKDLAKISMANLKVTSTFQTIKNDILPVTDKKKDKNHDSGSYPEIRERSLIVANSYAVSGANIKHRFHSDAPLFRTQDQGIQSTQGMRSSIINI